MREGEEREEPTERLNGRWKNDLKEGTLRMMDERRGEVESTENDDVECVAEGLNGATIIWPGLFPADSQGNGISQLQLPVSFYLFELALSEWACQKLNQYL